MVKKKKRSVEFLQDHTVSWCIERLNEIRDASDDIYFSSLFNDQEKRSLLSAYATQIQNIIYLIAPFEHEEDKLLEWSGNFVVEYNEPFV
jgi:hypothetical protein